MLLQNLYPKGQNSVIPRPLAAGIGILKVLPVYFSLNQPNNTAPYNALGQLEKDVFEF
jgi:hypothetical protein